MTVEDFYTLAQKHTFINFFACLCQCFHETRVNGEGFASELCINASNYAGIKVTPDWTGDIYAKVSWEQHLDGTKYNKKSYFRKYDNTEDFLSDYETKIMKNYPECVRKRESFWGYFDGLVSGRPYVWATDRAYFKRLCEVALLLAPQIFGDAYKDKLRDSLVYAIDNDYLTEENARTALALVHDMLEKDKPRPAPVLEEKVKNGKTTGVICIDAGHGGKDPGAVAGGVREKDIVITLAHRLCGMLNSRGYEARLSRVGDEFVPLTSRADFANRNNCDIFISLHCNSATNPDAHGFETWIAPKCSASSEYLAQEINRQWSKQFPKTAIRGVKRNKFTVLTATAMPAVLVETCFISNKAERETMMQSKTYDRAVQALFNAVQNYFRGGHYEN